jgi:hypothetical protein
LKTHPLPEVRDVAQKLHAALIARYPHSYRETDIVIDPANDTRDAYNVAMSARNHYQTPEDVEARFKLTNEERQQLKDGGLVVRREAVDLEGIKRHEKEALTSRPSGAHLPWRLESYGKYNFAFLLDYGSFRDIQRHRNGVCQIPLLDGRYGIHPWYLAAFKSLLSASDYSALQADIQAQYEAVETLSTQGVTTSAAEDQYYLPMGTMALVHVAYSVPETAYVGELRSGKTVHGSLRPIAQKMLEVLSHDLPDIALHGDFDDDSWTAKRGEQTISAKAG